MLMRTQFGYLLGLPSGLRMMTVNVTVIHLTQSLSIAIIPLVPLPPVAPWQTLLPPGHGPGPWLECDPPHRIYMSFLDNMLGSLPKHVGPFLEYHRQYMLYSL